MVYLHIDILRKHTEILISASSLLITRWQFFLFVTIVEAVKVERLRAEERWELKIEQKHTKNNLETCLLCGLLRSCNEAFGDRSKVEVRKSGRVRHKGALLCSSQRSAVSLFACRPSPKSTCTCIFTGVFSRHTQTPFGGKTSW